MKLKKGDLVYSFALRRVFVIEGKTTEFEYTNAWGEITNKGVLNYTLYDDDRGITNGSDYVQYIPNVGDVLVNSDGATKIVKELSANTLIAIGVNHYGDYSPALVEFKDLHKYTILRNFKLG